MMHTSNEELKTMKYLKIDDNKGYYLKSAETSQTWEELDKINKDDLLVLLNQAIEGDFEMDEFVEASLGNKAHQIIYKKLHEKFSNLVSMKNKFRDESASLYKEALEKYTKKDEPSGS